MTMMRYPGGTSAPRYYHPDRVAEAVENGWEVVEPSNPVSDDLTPRDVIANAIDQIEADDEGNASYWAVPNAVLTALDAAGWSITRKPKVLEDVRDAEGNYYGKQDVSHDHRTVGDYRAWCYDAGEWCYPSDPCRLCKEVAGGDS